MKAAVVRSFDHPPRYEDYPDPVAQQPGEVVVEVVATGLHPRVRSQAGGFHYTSTGQLPLIPGIDAVVRDSKGRLRYTILDDTRLGTMAARTIIDLDRSILLPDNVDPVLIAAAVNPVMSSWVALRQRIDFGRNQRVLILGATGNAGRMAIQVAKRFGASQVIAAGRERERLGELGALGADQTCTFDQLAAAAEVDVVLDYVWGLPAEAVLGAIAQKGAIKSGTRVRFVQIGSLAGPTISLQASTLRSANLEILGSGFGSASMDDIRKGIAEFFSLCAARKFEFAYKTAPLCDVESLWNAKGDGERLVFVP